MSPVELKEDDLVLTPPDETKLRILYEDLEFRTFSE